MVAAPVPISPSVRDDGLTVCAISLIAAPAASLFFIFVLGRGITLHR